MNDDRTRPGPNPLVVGAGHSRLHGPDRAVGAGTRASRPPRRFVSAWNQTGDRELGRRIRIADTFRSRLLGLLGRLPLDGGAGLLLTPCRAVHTFGRSEPIDVVMVSAEGIVVALYPAMPPGSRTAWHGDAACVLEVPSGVIAATESRLGDRIVWLPVEPRDSSP